MRTLSAVRIVSVVVVTIAAAVVVVVDVASRFSHRPVIFRVNVPFDTWFRFRYCCTVWIGTARYARVKCVHESDCHSRFRSCARDAPTSNSPHTHTHTSTQLKVKWRVRQFTASDSLYFSSFLRFDESSVAIPLRWYLRARPRDHYSPDAGMHTQFLSGFDSTTRPTRRSLARHSYTRHVHT